MLPDLTAIHVLRTWLTPRIAMDPARAVLGLVETLHSAGYVIVKAPTPETDKHPCDYPTCSVNGAGHPLACGCRSVAKEAK